MSDSADGRAAFQVLVLPYRHTAQGTVYALFRRADVGYWQGVAGGGEAGESPVQAARREFSEEAGLVGDREFVALDARATIPVVNVTGEFTWGPDVLVIPEYAFGVRAEDTEVTLSHEHTEFAWFTVADAAAAVQWDSNRTALWELGHRLRHTPAQRSGVHPWPVDVPAARPPTAPGDHPIQPIGRRSARAPQDASPEPSAASTLQL
ncbi:NUDIX domain-containing protein [Amycolatopsis sp. NPDC047767]|uniref:NUDIX hydrolase n=1 Tax=Amycolatopsis sp. NPDC047767 TaxID=3156765 RepID=UPI0034567E70